MSKRTYTVNIHNDGESKERISIFGIRKNYESVNWGLPKNIRMDVGESSVLEMLHDIKGKSFNTTGFRVESNDKSQINQILLIAKSDEKNDQLSSYPLAIANYLSPYQSERDTERFPLKYYVEIFPYMICIDKDVDITFNIMPLAKVRLTFYEGDFISILKQ